MLVSYRKKFNKEILIFNILLFKSLSTTCFISGTLPKWPYGTVFQTKEYIVKCNFVLVLT